jgi:hypothetical protein
MSALEATAPKPPETIQEYRDELRITALSPKIGVIKQYDHKELHLYGQALEHWQAGFRAGIEHALKLLEAIQP